MPFESKPLIRPDVLREKLRYFNLPAAVKALRPDLENWKALIESKRLDEHTEKERLPDFLIVFFGKLLGYTGPAQRQTRWQSSSKSVTPSGSTCTRTRRNRKVEAHKSTPAPRKTPPSTRACHFV